ncbi:hypothetical protein [Sphingobium yanoikuyae]|uniref:Uncharacterized protein n=1 Tax=Sphingobium yanoikuyae TaxID=13690 RepID=A0A9X7YAG6_SPHYA|nr:hypothetical protein [Sphingobium yanoikuyae]QNG43646.1 hypothetical protein H3V42_17020 [Sphingobium yanoikuyae]
MLTAIAGHSWLRFLNKSEKACAAVTPSGNLLRDCFDVGLVDAIGLGWACSRHNSGIVR